MNTWITPLLLKYNWKGQITRITKAIFSGTLIDVHYKGPFSGSCRLSEPKTNVWQENVCSMTYLIFTNLANLFRSQSRQLYIFAVIFSSFSCEQSKKDFHPWIFHPQLTYMSKQQYKRTCIASGGGGRGTRLNFWWRCAARLSKLWPYFRRKYVIFRLPFFKPGL